MDFQIDEIVELYFEPDKKFKIKASVDQPYEWMEDMPMHQTMTVPAGYDFLVIEMKGTFSPFIPVMKNQLKKIT